MALKKITLPSIKECVDFLKFFTGYAIIFTITRILGEGLTAKLLRWSLTQPNAKRLNVAKKSIRHAFPEKTEQQVNALAERHIDCYTVPILCHLIFTRERLRWAKNATRLKDDSLTRAQPAFKDAIILLMHHADFLFWHIALSADGIKMHAVSTTHENKFYGRFLESLYSDYALSVIGDSGYNNLRKLSIVIKKREGIIFTIDKHMRDQKSVEVPFFSHPHRVAFLPFKIAVEHERPIIPMIFFLKKDKKGKRYIEKHYAPSLRADPKAKDPIQDLATRSIAVFEQWIREKPEFWSWGYDHFRT